MPDALAKAAADGGQLSQAAQGLVRDAELLVRHEAAVLGAATQPVRAMCEEADISELEDCPLVSLEDQDQAFDAWATVGCWPPLRGGSSPGGLPASVRRLSPAVQRRHWLAGTLALSDASSAGLAWGEAVCSAGI